MCMLPKTNGFDSLSTQIMCATGMLTKPYSQNTNKKNTKKKKTQKDPKNPRLNHEITKSKIGERETKESKKQKRESIQKKERVPSARWLRTTLRMSSNCLRDYLLDSGYEFASD